MAAAKSAGNVTVTFNGNNISAYLNDAQVQMVWEELEKTNLTSTAKEYIPGLADITATLPFAFWDSTLDGYVYAAWGTLVTTAIARDDGATTVTYTWTSNSFITGYDLGSPAAAIQAGQVALRLNGLPSRATA